MATVAGVKPHPIYLAGSWVDSPTLLEIANPARPGELAGQGFAGRSGTDHHDVELDGQRGAGHPPIMPTDTRNATRRRADAQRASAGGCGGTGQRLP